MNSGTTIATRARTSRALAYIIAGVAVGLFVVATGYFTLNMIAMFALQRTLGQ